MSECKERIAVMLICCKEIFQFYSHILEYTQVRTYDVVCNRRSTNNAQSNMRMLTWIHLNQC